LKILDYLIDNKEWIFSGIGIIVITGIGALVRNILNIKKKNFSISNNINSNNVNITVNERRIPKLAIKAEKRECRIFNPEVYSEINSYKNIINYRNGYLQQLVDEMNINIINVGYSFAKDVNIKFSLKKEECLLTNKNMFWIFESLLLENYENNTLDDLLIQSYKIPILESGERVRLPLNQTINGVIVSCLFNTSYFINFEEQEFSEMGSVYENLKNNLPLKPPVLYISIEYCDEDGAVRKEQYKVLFKIKFIQFCEFLCVEYNEAKISNK